MQSHLRALLALAVTTFALGACARSEAPGESGPLRVVAVESFWGSIAAQVGGDRVEVTTVIANPNTDPHDYEPTAKDARAFAAARYVVVNGAGYDTWASKLLKSNPVAGRQSLNVADLAGRKDGDNPHMWYSPAIVREVADRIAADLGAIDPTHSGDYQQRAAAFKASGLARYDSLRSDIHSQYAGATIAATETVFDDMTADLGLTDAAPAAFKRAISEGEDVAPRDQKALDDAIASGRVQALVYNTQNSTPDTRSVLARARTAGVPVVEITETLIPASASFQDWQSSQLTALLAALQQSARR
jgi:zinc/manganese transport system substrate-binding protein